MTLNTKESLVGSKQFKVLTAAYKSVARRAGKREMQDVRVLCATKGTRMLTRKSVLCSFGVVGVREEKMWISVHDEREEEVGGLLKAKGPPRHASKAEQSKANDNRRDGNGMINRRKKEEDSEQLGG